jgi:hypothetical protein
VIETASQDCRSITDLIAARSLDKGVAWHALGCTTVLGHLQIRRCARWIGVVAGGAQYT